MRPFSRTRRRGCINSRSSPLRSPGGRAWQALRLGNNCGAHCVGLAGDALPLPPSPKRVVLPRSSRPRTGLFSAKAMSDRDPRSATPVGPFPVIDFRWRFGGDFIGSPHGELLAGLPRIEWNPHVIAGAKDGPPRSDLKKPWAAVSRAAGLEGVRIHDLRHSFASASFGAGASLGLPIIRKLLGHSQPATTARYAHFDADPMRRTANTIGATISAAMGGLMDANVVTMKKPVR